MLSPGNGSLRIVWIVVMIRMLSCLSLGLAHLSELKLCLVKFLRLSADSAKGR